MKKIVYIDMDNVMVDFPSGIAKLDEKTKQEYDGRYDEVEGIFSLMEPMPNAISAYIIDKKISYLRTFYRPLA